MEREAWQATVHGVAENQTRLSVPTTTSASVLPAFLRVMVLR